MPPLKVCVLGPLQIQAADRPMTSLESDKARALLAYLAVESDRPHRREQLVGLLWPDSPEDLARGNLRQALYSLRQAIGDATADPPYLLVSRDEIQFNTASDHTLDIEAFRAGLAACDRHGHAQLESCGACAEFLQDAVAHYRGKFLEQFFVKDSAEFEEWAVMQRESLHRRALQALEHLADYHLRRAEYDEARRHALRQLELDPWREEAHRQLMVALAGAGQRSAALVQYETCRRVLRDELGVEPASETKELYAKISRGELGARQSDERHGAVSARRPLPAPITPFVGRERELAALARLLADPNCRLITLVGPGGMGKTRLALEAAARYGPAFRDGAAFVPLASTHSAATILPALAGALGLAFYGPTDPQAQLFALLSRVQMLLVLDNVEHLLEAAGLWVEILQNAPEVKLLVTSREALSLQGEWVFELEGLPVPEDERADDLEDHPAAALFLQRARRARVGFELRNEERPAVARLCCLVGGMPLALELAATWVRTLSCSEIAQEIEGSTDFLAAPIRDLDERHRSVRAVFEQSWQMLTPEEQRVLARLSVFHGGFLREAAQQVTGATLLVLSALAAKSLLRRAAEGRYGLHELVRQYAASQLAASPAESRESQERHSTYYLDWLGGRDAALRSSSQKAVLAELTAEMANLRAAWDWAVVSGDVARVYRVSPTLWYLFQHHNWFAEGEAVFRRAAETLQVRAAEGGPGGAGQDALLRNAVSAMLAHSGYFAFSRGKNEEAYALLSASAAQLRAGGDARAAAYALWYLGIAGWGSGRYAEAVESFKESLAKAREAREPYYEAAAGMFLGVVEHELGEYSQAGSSFTAALAAARKLGDIMLLAHLLSYASLTALALGGYDEAEKMLHESLALAREIDCRTSEALALDALGQVAAARGNDHEAGPFFAAACQIYREIGSAWNLLRVLCRQGLNSLALGHLAEAKGSLTESLRIACASGLAAPELDALAGLAQLAQLVASSARQAAPDGAGTFALEIAFQVLDHPASTQQARNLAAGVRTELETALTPEQIALAQQRARSRSLDELAQLVSAY